MSLFTIKPRTRGKGIQQQIARLLVSLARWVDEDSTDIKALMVEKILHYSLTEKEPWDDIDDHMRIGPVDIRDLFVRGRT